MVPELLKEGHQVTVIDNFMYNQTSLSDCCYDKNLTIIRGDTRSEKLISKYLKDVDYIFPLACLTGAPLAGKNPMGAQTTNLEAVELILKLRDEKQRIIFPTTNSGYGIGQEGVYCDENTLLNPISLYGKLKVEAEKKVLETGPSITLRLATVFGMSPRMRLDLLVNDFTYRAVNDHYLMLFESYFKRNYIHIRDVVGAFVHCLNNFE